MTNPLSDEQLLRASATDSEAFGILVERYEERLLRYIRRLGVSANDLEDVLQEAFLRMYTAQYQFRDAWSFSSWAYRIAHNQAVSWLRKHKRKDGVQFTLDDEAGEGRRLLETLASEETPEEALNKKELNERLTKAIQELPENYRYVFMLQFFEGRSQNDIADILTIPRATVATRVRRAKKRLQKALSE